MKHKQKLTITDWAEEDRPREKMLLKGLSALSDAELLAILIGSGNKDETAVELSQRILQSTKNNLNNLGKLQIKDLINGFKGIGEAKAITIVAALELGKRRKSADLPTLPQITSSRDVYHILHPVLGDLKHEEAWILLLNKANRVLKKEQLNKGGIANTIVDIRIVMKTAIDNLSSSIILCHNHPSGNNTPSQDDHRITNQLKEAGVIMNIPLLDHVIICDGSYFSYKDTGLL